MSSDAAADRLESPFSRRPPRAEPAASRRGLELRAMTGWEEELVERRRGDADTVALCNELLARCLVAPGADAAESLARVRALPIADRDAALVALRRRSFGDLVRSSATCPACGAPQGIEFDLAKLPVEVSEAPERIEADVGGVAAVLRLPTAGDQEAIAAAAPGTNAERRTLLLARLLVRLGNVQGPFEAAFARELTVAVRRGLEEAIERAAPSLDLEMAVTCAACNHAFVAPFDVAGFFLPS